MPIPLIIYSVEEIKQQYYFGGAINKEHLESGVSSTLVYQSLAEKADQKLSQLFFAPLNHIMARVTFNPSKDLCKIDFKLDSL